MQVQMDTTGARTARANLNEDAALRDEQRRMRKLRLLVDLTAALLRDRPVSRHEAESVVEHLRIQVLRLFPGKGDVFDLIYRPRFRRLIDERFGPPAG
jgi:hypothetical protein